MVQNSFLYGAEIWKVTESYKKKLKTDEMIFLRRSTRQYKHRELGMKFH